MGLKVNQQHNLEQLFDKFATIDPKNRKETKTVEKESNKKNPTEQKYSLNILKSAIFGLLIFYYLQ